MTFGGPSTTFADAPGWPLHRARRRAGEGIDGLQFRLLYLSVLFLPLNWLLGTTLPWLFAAGAILAISMARFSVAEWLLLALVLALSLGLAVGILTDFKAGRSVAAAYNIGVLLLLLVFLNWGRQLQMAGARWGPSAVDRVYLAAFVTYLTHVGVIVGTRVYVAVTGDMTLEFDALVLRFAGHLPGLLGLYKVNELVLVDWLDGGPDLRIFGLGAHATEGAILFAMIGLLAVIHLYRRQRFWWLLGAELTMLPLLWMMGSRTVVLAYLASMLLLVVLLRRGTLLVALLVAPLLIVGVVAYGGEAWTLLWQSAERLTEVRAGSAETRLMSYTLAIERVLDTNIITGLGIKPLHEAMPGIPIGSHSSFVSIFTKGGLLALGIFVSWYLYILWRIGSSQLALYGGAEVQGCGSNFELVTLSRIILIHVVWWITEDLDAPAYQAALGGLVIGLFIAMCGQLRRRTRPAWPA